MIRKLLSILLIVGACNAYPHEDQSNVEPSSNPINPEKNLQNPVKGPFEPEGPVAPERDPVAPERGLAFDADPEKHPVDPERDPLPVENGSVPTEDPEGILGPQDAPKPDESDLKTDATFWWPSYRTYWSYPTYRTYWSYPTYRYNRPRSYYSYYYW